ncbi:MJ1255/VC2487 family glycosyltransferase [Aestuariibacter salexigens]|uniref:MJ1255/VC2487 family glycosyltransferase n=1 Tax=Aestuariibacter salexigens TaxID=226010 RepID=UPI00041E6FF0|nr:MJ1255/VC2487 family glycosyltransferase [Aestuariibacter salexigens]
MKILYGVQGTGKGHIARARIMADAFSQRDDVYVDFLFSGRDESDYFDMHPFDQYQTRRGLTFVTQRGRVSQWQTLKQANLVQLWRDVKALDLSDHDLVINDFEPVSAWAAKRQDTPCISISHQAAFAYDVPTQGDSAIDRLLTRYFAPSNIKLGVHWYHFNKPIVPPFITDKAAEKASLAHVLVYLPFESLDDIQGFLEPLSEYRFEIFHPAVKQNDESRQLAWRKTSKQHFRHALQHCRGVIANGGFELSSECLQLGKKLLMKPLTGQYEQLSNALTLSTLELCHTMYSLDTDVVEEWLEKPGIEPITFPDNPHILIDWLLAGDWQNTEPLCETLWQQVQFPDKTRLKLAQLHPSA